MCLNTKLNHAAESPNSWGKSPVRKKRTYVIEYNSHC